jgi:K+-transporting ATPase ATPase C chain
MQTHIQTAFSSVKLLVIFTLLLGGIYPIASTLMVGGLFPSQATGSLIYNKTGQVTGSTLIGQQQQDKRYFWSRPSATAVSEYNAMASGGSNLSPHNPALLTAIKGRVDALKASDPTNTALIPIDLVTASGSGLDPHISIEAAIYQENRIAQARGLTPSRVRSLIDKATTPRFLGILGQPTVNVLKLNQLLDQ